MCRECDMMYPYETNDIWKVEIDMANIGSNELKFSSPEEALNYIDDVVFKCINKKTKMIDYKRPESISICKYTNGNFDNRWFVYLSSL